MLYCTSEGGARTDPSLRIHRLLLRLRQRIRRIAYVCHHRDAIFPTDVLPERAAGGYPTLFDLLFLHCVSGEL